MRKENGRCCCSKDLGFDGFAILTVTNNLKVQEGMAKYDKITRGSEAKTLYTNLKQCIIMVQR